ncbi:MAG: DegT/DnrJ/EryC1/StrS family aminotransferase, partial [Patescibacteria group bacterium]
MMNIKLARPCIGEEEISAVVDALQKTEISGLFGSCITEFEKGFANYCECEQGIAVANGTVALHLA